MPETISCPKCRRAIQIPESLRGEPVQCPLCFTIFAPHHGAADTPLALAPATATTTQAGDESASPGRPLPIQSDSIGRARGLVIPPALGLLFANLLGIVLNIGAIIVFATITPERFERIVTNANYPPKFRELCLKTYTQDYEAAHSGPLNILQALFSLLNLVCVLGAVRMMMLHNWKFALTTSVLGMLNCSNACCCLGIPLGVWAILVLLQPHVHQAFDA